MIYKYHEHCKKDAGVTPHLFFAEILLFLRRIVEVLLNIVRLFQGLTNKNGIIDERADCGTGGSDLVYWSEVVCELIEGGSGLLLSVIEHNDTSKYLNIKYPETYSPSYFTNIIYSQI